MDAMLTSGDSTVPADDDSSALAQPGQPYGEQALLSEETRFLRTVEAERDLLRAQNEILREANQNLVLATFGAQSLRDEAEAANQRQNEFLAMLAHELRNPLAPISMANAILAQMPAPSTQLLNVQKIIGRQVKHLSRLLDDLLDAARISSGKITLLRRPVLLADLLQSTVETVQLRMNERRQQLELHVPPEDIMLDADPVRLAQVFSNLLVNASKFTQDGGKIVLSAWLAGDTLMITVADNGAGMSPDVILNIFALFTQGPRSLARSEGGLGVGLNVVRNVVEMHGGSVNASSPGLGHGSVFTLALPMSDIAVPSTVSAQRHRTAAPGHRILLIEDNLDASETLSMFLRSEGHSVVTEFDGPTGLATAYAHAFDVLICDIGLPGMNGYDLIRNLRATVGANIPFAIAVSGYGQPEDKARAIAAGFGQYLVKPVDVDALLSLIGSQAMTRLVKRE
jgi:signal transduction histidine kinase/ActR/RegA family two-component response regulator